MPDKKKINANGLKNLTPFNTLPRERLVEMGKKGAAVVNQQKKEKKALKELISLGMDILKKQWVELLPLYVQNEEARKILEQTDPAIFVLINELSSPIPAQRLQAANSLLDRLHGKPVNSEQDISPKLIQININRNKSDDIIDI